MAINCSPEWNHSIKHISLFQGTKLISAIVVLYTTIDYFSSIKPVKAANLFLRQKQSKNISLYNKTNNTINVTGRCWENDNTTNNTL